MTEITEFLLWLWELLGVKVIVAHTLLNVMVAVAAAMKTGEFDLKKISEFLYRKLAPYVLVYGVVKVLSIEAIGLTGFDWIAAVALATIEATLLADLAENLNRLGIPMPEFVRRFVPGVNRYGGFARPVERLGR